MRVNRSDSRGMCNKASGNEFFNKKRMENGWLQLSAFRGSGLNILDHGEVESVSDTL